MFEYTRTEIAAGVFVLVGLVLIAYLSISIGGLKLVPEQSYGVAARFANVGDLKPNAPVKVAGVTIGKVRRIKLADYLAEAELAIDRKVALSTDTIASITTAGLLGDAYISLSPGAADGTLVDGGRIVRTEPALNMSDLIGRYAFGGSSRGDKAGEERGEDDGKLGPAPSKEKP